MKKIILILILSTYGCLFSQIKIPNAGYIGIHNPRLVDSIFINFEKPQLPNKYFSLEWEEIYLLCEVQTNNEGIVDSIFSYPLNKHHWRFGRNDSIWIDAQIAIDKASKNWQFKLVEWDIDSMEPEEAKKLYTKFNKEKTSLPFNGQPSYLLLIEFCHECHHGSTYTFISYIDIYK